ncbi:MAG: lipoprotein [Pseudomonadota bacterium]
MKNSFTSWLKLSLLLTGIALFAACGQKGPLEIEPQDSIQEDVSEDTI